MSKSRKYRFDILGLYVVTAGCVFYSVQMLHMSAITSSVLIICLLVESFMLWEPRKKREANGILPALALCILIISLILLKYKFTIPRFTGSDYLAVILLVAGFIIRLISFKTLKNAFSYSLAVSDTQQLITSGVYSIIRHPAYLGTFFYVAGVVMMYRVIIGIAAIVLFIPVTIRRIRKEEGMLLKQYGKEYNDYRKKTRALIPYIW